MQPDLPPGRYDPPRRSARVLTYLLASVLAVGLTGGGYALYARNQAGKLSSQLQGYDVRSDTLVRITFEVANKGKRGECKVRARDRTGTETGSQIVPVQPARRKSQQVSVDLPTRARAVTGELVGCRQLRPGDAVRP